MSGKKAGKRPPIGPRFGLMPSETVATLSAELHALRTGVNLTVARRQELTDRLARTDPVLRRHRNVEQTRLGCLEARLRGLDPRQVGAARVLSAAIRQSRQRLGALDQALTEAVAKAPTSTPARPSAPSPGSPGPAPRELSADPAAVAIARAMVRGRLLVVVSLIDGLLPAAVADVVHKAVAVEIERLD